MRAQFRRHYRAIAALGAISLLHVMIHVVVPARVQLHLAFDHQRLAPWTLLTGAYVHNSTTHLLGNLLGFGVSAAVAYALCVLQGRQRWFWKTTAGFLLVLPVVVHMTSYAAFQSLGIEPTSRGFSGVVAGYVGFILFALVRDIADRHGTAIGQPVALGVMVLLLAEVTLIYVGVPSPLVTGLLLGALALSIGALWQRGRHRAWDTSIRGQLAVETAQAAAIVVILVLFVWALFPAQLVTDGTTTNIVAHAAGIMWGLVLAGATALRTGRWAHDD